MLLDGDGTITTATVYRGSRIMPDGLDTLLSYHAADNARGICESPLEAHDTRSDRQLPTMTHSQAAGTGGFDLVIASAALALSAHTLRVQLSLSFDACQRSKPDYDTPSSYLAMAGKPVSIVTRQQQHCLFVKT